MNLSVNVKEFFPRYGKEFFSGYGKEFFPRFCKEFLPEYGKEFFLSANRDTLSLGNDSLINRDSRKVYALVWGNCSSERSAIAEVYRHTSIYG